ncbi:MAG: ABC transporter substrate-binding protein [Crocinitomicaceae bacterium]|nr:ABC transporter substrate-binding protein [Crocinitomicaceae bacterium]
MKFLSVIFVGFSLLFFAGCSDQNGKETIKDNNAKNEIDYAKTIEIFEDSIGCKVHIYNPDTKKTVRLYLAKTNKNTPDNYQFIKTPIRSIITLSGTQIGMLSELNSLDVIVGVSSKAYIYNPVVLKNIETNKIKDFGDETLISFEQIIESKAQLLMYSGFSSDFPHAEQLAKAGVICIPDYDWKEQHPLGKAEWIKFFGYLVGKEKLAKTYFEDCAKAYNELKKSVAGVRTKPTVFSGNMTGTSWFTPAGESYNAMLLSDAGGNYVYAKTKGVGSLDLSFEKVLKENIESEFWVNPGISSLPTILKNNGKMRYFKAVKYKNVFCYSSNMNKYWEMSAIQPHFVLSDLIRILHPEKSKAKHSYFYKNICR